MPPFNPNVAANSAITEVLPKNEYLLTLFEPKVFSRKYNDKDGVEQELIGVRYPARVAEGDHNGKKCFPEFVMSNDGGVGSFKRFAMACLGFESTGEGEAKFNEQYGNLDFMLDAETGHLGDAYRLVTGKAVYCTMDVRTDKNDTSKEYQSYKSWSRANR